MRHDPRPPIDVVLVDDRALVREALAALLATEPGLRVVAESVDGEDALRRFPTLGRAVAVVACGLERLGGIELTRRSLALGLPIAILLVASERGAEQARAAIEAGACGYLYEDTTRAAFTAAILDVAAGRRVLPVGLDPALLAAPLRGDVRHAELTLRERDVVRLVAAGLASKAIADRLGLTARTVEWYRASVMRKLGIDSIAVLVKYALVHDLARLDR